MTFMESPQRIKARQAILDYLLAQGLRKTNQRRAIIEAAMGTREHFSAEELLVMARRIDPTVSRATVYRTLPLLVEGGLLRELDLGGEMKRYDPNFVDHPTHNHLICLDCGEIFEFEDAHLELLENCIARRLGFVPAVKSTKIEARCEELAKRGHCTQKERLRGMGHPAGSGAGAEGVAVLR